MGVGRQGEEGGYRPGLEEPGPVLLVDRELDVLGDAVVLLDAGSQASYRGHLLRAQRALSVRPGHGQGSGLDHVMVRVGVPGDQRLAEPADGVHDRPATPARQRVGREEDARSPRGDHPLHDRR